MDPSKRDTLIQWVNLINPLLTIESLTDLRDGEQFIALISKINRCPYDELYTRAERFEIVQTFIQDYYHHSFVGQVNFDKDNELDIAKIAILVLTAGIQGEHQEDFSTPALSLDERSQVEIMNILKDVVSDDPSRIDLDSLLINKTMETYDSTNVSGLCSPERNALEKTSFAMIAKENTRSTSTSSLNEILSPFQRINVNYTTTPTTPLHTLINSTGFTGRIIQRERNRRNRAENEIEEKKNLIKKMSSDLNMERHLRSEVELDIQEKVKTIVIKDDKIRELNSQIRVLKQLQDRVDELNNIKEDHDQLVADAEKAKCHLDELKSLRLINNSLKKENSEVYDELNKLKEMKTQFKILQLDRKRYLEELQREEKKHASLQLTLKHKQKLLDDAISSKNFTEDNLTKIKEIYEHLKTQHEEVVAFQSANDPPGEKMTVITDQLIDELKEDLENVKTNWVTPEIHEQLKSDLAKAVSEKDKFESKSIQLSEESLSIHSESDLLKKEIQKLEIEEENSQRNMVESRRTIAKLWVDLESFAVKENSWHQCEIKYKGELQQYQGRLAQLEMELSCVSTELKLTNVQLETDTKHNENRRQTLVQSMSDLRNEKKMLEQRFLSDKAAVEEKATHLKVQLESLKVEFSNNERELLTKYESGQVEKRELERQLETERRLRDNAEKSLTFQREESEKELTDTVGILKADIKEREKEIDSLQCQLREKTDEFDTQVESLTSLKFELQSKINKLESQISIENQEILTLHAEMRKYEEKLLEHEQSISKLSDKLSKSNNEKNTVQERLQDVENKLTAANNDSQHWIKKNSSEKKDFDTKLLTLEQEHNTFVEASKTAQKKLSQQVRSTLEDNFELNVKLQKHIEQLYDTKAELEEKSQQIESLQEQLGKLQKLHCSLQEQYALLNNNLVKVQSQLVLKEAECCDWKDKLEKMAVEKSSFEEKLGSTQQALSQEIVNLNEQIDNKNLMLNQAKSSLGNFTEKIIKATKPGLPIENIDPFANLDSLINYLDQEIYRVVEEKSNELETVQKQYSSQTVQISEMKECFDNQLKSANKSNVTLKSHYEDIVLEHKQLQTKLTEQENQLEKYMLLKESLEDTKTSLESQLCDKENSFKVQLEIISEECNKVKNFLEEKNLIEVQLREQAEEVAKEHRMVLEELQNQLQKEGTNAATTISNLNSELETVKQSALEMETKLKFNLEQLTTEYSIKLDKEQSEKVNQLKQISQKIFESESKITDLSTCLAERSSLLEQYGNQKNKLEESVSNLQQKISESETETKEMKCKLEKKENNIKEKEAKLEELFSIVEVSKQQVVELSEKHVAEIAAVQQEFEQRIGSVTGEYERKMSEEYVSKSLAETQQEEHLKELNSTRLTLQSQHEYTICRLMEEHDMKLKNVTETFENTLSNEYIAIGDFQEKNQKHAMEVVQMKNKVEEYEGKIRSQIEEHKEALKKVAVEFEENISANFIPKNEFEEHKKKNSIKFNEIVNQFKTEKEDKLAIIKDHEISLVQLSSSYEERLANEYVSRGIYEEEQRKLTETTQNLETTYQEKLASHFKEHENVIGQKISEYEENISTNYVPKFQFEDIQTKLSQKEKELSHHRAEFDLIVATSEKVSEQHEASVKTYKERVSELSKNLVNHERQIECLQEQLVEEKVHSERHYNEMKRNLEKKLTEENDLLKVSQQELIKIHQLHEEEVNKCNSFINKVNDLESSKHNEISCLKDSFQLELNKMKEEYQNELNKLETNYKTEISQLKDYHVQEQTLSQTKCEELQQCLITAKDDYETSVSKKQQEHNKLLSDLKNQLLIEKESIADKLAKSESEFLTIKEKHESILETHEETVEKLNSIVNQTKEECQHIKEKNTKMECQFREREQRIILDNMKTLSQAEERNKSLVNRLKVAQKVTQMTQKKFEKSHREMESLSNDLKATKQLGQKAMDELQEYKRLNLQQEGDFSIEKENLEKTIRKLNEKCSEKQAHVENLEEGVKHYKTRKETKLSKLAEQCEDQQGDIEMLKNKVLNLEKENKSLAAFLTKEQKKFRDTDKDSKNLKRKITFLTEQLEKAEGALFDNSSPQLNNDSMESPATRTLTEGSYELRSMSINSRKTMRVRDCNISPISIQSTSSAASYKSAKSVNVSTTSKTPVPSGCGRMFSCEDEPNMFDWSRISEIKRRNTMFPAHLRSAYPVEFQNLPNVINNDITKPSSGKRKRKSPAAKITQNKEVKNRAGTPGKLRRPRVQTRLTDRENTPKSEEKRIRTTITPVANQGYTGRSSTAFEITNTPILAHRRQKGRSTIFQNPQPQRQPLKQRNRIQTNL